MADELNLSQGSEPIPRIRMSEIGSSGLAEMNGHIYEEVKKELLHPYSLDTYRNMYKDPLIYAGLNLTMNMISKVETKVMPPANPTEDELKKTQFIRQCMDDMDHSWTEFIKSVLSYMIYGFSVNEKVFRRRTKAAGSKHNDNLVGWKKLARRSQRTIRKWKYSKDGRDFLGAFQDLSMVHSDSSRFQAVLQSDNYTPDGLYIPARKLLHFRYGNSTDNPEGESPLAACWSPWKYKTIIEEHEAIGITRDMVGMPVIRLHPKYMSPDATPEEQQVYEDFKKIVRNIHSGEQSGLVIPQMFDENGKPIIDFELMGVQGGKQYDTDTIVKRYEDKILTALFADILKLGQTSHGSFSLAGAKTNITAINISTRMAEIADVINNDLIKQTFELNGWDTDRLPKIQFEDLDEEDLDQLSKMIQRLGSVNFLPRTPDMISQTVKRAGFDNYEAFAEMDQESLDGLFTDNESGASEGMQEGMPSGTGQASGSGSETNSENAS